jgi:transposase InsO family protein
MLFREEWLLLCRAPPFICINNTPEFIAKAFVAWRNVSGSATADITPGSSQKNPFVELLNGRFRDEFLNTELFSASRSPRFWLTTGEKMYNDYRPHSSLDGQTSSEYAQQWAN